MAKRILVPISPRMPSDAFLTALGDLDVLLSVRRPCQKPGQVECHGAIVATSRI